MSASGIDFDENRAGWASGNAVNIVDNKYKHLMLPYAAEDMEDIKKIWWSQLAFSQNLLSQKAFAKTRPFALLFNFSSKSPKEDFNPECSAFLLKEVTSFDCFELHASPY